MVGLGLARPSALALRRLRRAAVVASNAGSHSRRKSSLAFATGRNTMSSAARSCLQFDTCCRLIAGCFRLKKNLLGENHRLAVRLARLGPVHGFGSWGGALLARSKGKQDYCCFSFCKPIFVCILVFAVFEAECFVFVFCSKGGIKETGKRQRSP